MNSAKKTVTKSTEKKTAELDKEFLAEITAKLQSEKEIIEKELSSFTKKDPHAQDNFNATFPKYGDEEDDNAHEVAEYTANKPLELTLEKTLRDVIKSLERIKKGTYGICKYCQKPIDKKRLLARPNSSACVSCKKTITEEF
jgi:DnaK suppressor protein